MSIETSTITLVSTATSTRATTAARPRRLEVSWGHAAAVIFLIAASVLALGGAYLFAAVPIMAAATGLAMVCRPRILAIEDRQIDLSLIILTACLALQLVPLPAALLGRISPGAAAFNAAYRLDGASGSAPGTLSVEPASTVYGLALTATVILVFWTCRRVFDGGGARLVARGIAWTGLSLALLAIVQRATSPYLIYWRWQPDFQNAQPFGPFVNRNHFATWVVMAIPLCLGYLMARHQRDAGARRPFQDRLARIARAFDSRSIWLAVAGSVMTLSVFLSRSRSGILSLAAGLAFFWYIARGRMRRRSLAWLGFYAAVLVIVLAMWSNPGAVMSRFQETISGGFDSADRWTIWRETMPALRDFWATGTGAGTYQTAMLLYQRSYRAIVYFNQAHNHYLQVATEGGLLLLLPALFTAASFVRLAARRLRQDTTAVFWIRAGALSGLSAVAFQSIWETGLRMPGNAILFAALAALAVHRDSLLTPSPAPPASLLQRVRKA